MGKSSLGRGFDSLMATNRNLVHELSAGAAGETVVQLDLSLVDSNPWQPRRKFDDDEILELSQSIQKQGLLQPITVRRNADRFQIIAGERRVRACRLLNMERIPALVKDRVSDRMMAELGLIENLQRVDLNPVEESRAMMQLVENYGYTHDQLAEQLGRSRAAVTNALRLLRLPDEVLGWLAEGKLTAGHARALLAEGVADPVAAARDIIEKGLNVRQAEQAATSKRKGNKAPKPKKPKARRNPQLSQLEQDIGYALGTEVAIEELDGIGTISIRFSSKEEFNAIYARIMGK